jgi:type I restriction enzyme S subunit
MSIEGTAPTRWDIAKLEDVVDILDSRRVPVNAKERGTRVGQVPYYGATGQVGWIDDFLFDEELVLLGEDGAPFLEPVKQKAYIVRGKSWVNNHAHVLRARSDIPNAYIKYYLDTVDYHEFVTGTTRLKLNQAAMRRIPIPLAPPNERAGIVAEIEKQFSRLDEAVTNLKRVRANLKRYKASVLKAAVEGKLTEDWRKQHPNVEPASKLLERSLAERRAKWNGRGKYKESKESDTNELPALPEKWTWATVDQLTSMVTSGSRGWGGYYSDTGPIFIRAQDIKTDSLKLENVARVRITTNAEGTRTAVTNGDVLITITGANVTKSALVRRLSEQAFVSQHVALLKPCLAEVGGFKVLVQHLYPGDSRSEGVVHGTLSPIDPYGT